MLFDKPVINTVFGNASNGLYDDQRFLGYEHIMHVVNSKATTVVTDAAALIAAIQHDLSLDDKSKNRKQLIAQQIGVDLNLTSTMVAKALRQWS
jgi:uncharacterized Fe-S center protein